MTLPLTLLDYMMAVGACGIVSAYSWASASEHPRLRWWFWGASVFWGAIALRMIFVLIDATVLLLRAQ